jgi:radical SAM protein with 4Fe4S-binding SPASM domain
LVLSAKKWKDILEKIKPHARTLKITGGEPTLHPEFHQIMQSVDALGIPFTIFTNARWKNTGQVIKQLSTLRNLGGLLVSLHGHTAEIHEDFTNTHLSFDQTCQTIQFATQAGLRVHTSTVITRANYRVLDEIAFFSHTLGAKRAVFNRFLGEPTPELDLSNEELRHAIREIENMVHKGFDFTDEFRVRYGNCIPQCFSTSTSSGCWAGVAYCTIDPRGNIRPCNHSPTIVGNILKESLDVLWENETMEGWRELTPDDCIACGAYEQCHGGCRAMREIHPSENDPLMRVKLPPQPATKIELFELSRPILNCEIFPESFGFTLIRGLSIFPVRSEAQAILDALSGEYTLSDLQRHFGQDGLNFVGELARRGFVRLIN